MIRRRAGFLPDTARRVMPEPVVPMINVVFLLLIFFLMTAQFIPPPPVEVTPPEADAAPQAAPGARLYLDRDGTLAFNDLRGDAALAAAITAPTLDIHADAQAPANVLAQLLSQLGQHEGGEVRLITQGAP